MNEEHTKALIEACPILYRGRTEGPRENLMCFGFECDDGWFGLVHAASERIERIAEKHTAEQKNWEKAPKAFQVKEKFGTLRMYVGFASEEIEVIVDHAEKLSSITCQYCGRWGSTRFDLGWFYTLCDECYKPKIEILLGNYTKSLDKALEPGQQTHGGLCELVRETLLNLFKHGLRFIPDKITFGSGEVVAVWERPPFARTRKVLIFHPSEQIKAESWGEGERGRPQATLTCSPSHLSYLAGFFLPPEDRLLQ